MVAGEGMINKLIDAIKVYTEFAYPDREMPENIKAIVDKLRKSDFDSLFSLPFFEKVDKDVYALRLGNVF